MHTCSKLSAHSGVKAVNLLALSCVLSLQACGGGAGSSTNTVVAPADVQTPVVPDNTLAQPDEALISTVASPGWSEPTGVLLADVGNAARWSFNSQPATNWSLGSVSSMTYDDASKAISLNFDFGCGTTAVTTRTLDCRNVVAMYSNLATPVTATSNSVIALKVRNTDISAEYALRIRDSGGQTLQYPLQVRTIEYQDSSKWSLVRVPLKYPSMYWGGANDGRISGGIVQISIVAVPRNSDSATTGLNYPKGVFELKSAQLIANAGTTYQLNANAPLDTTGLLPSLDGRLVVAHGSFDLAQLNKAKEAGFTAIRRDLLWESVERSGRFVFDDYSPGLVNLNALGLKVLWILSYGHPDHGGAVPVSAGDLNAYSEYVKAASQFGKTTPAMGYEVWNEPNLPGYWPTPDPVAYSNLFSLALTAVRQFDSAIPVVTGGVTIDDPSFLFRLAKTSGVNGAAAFGIHPYRKDIMVTQGPVYRRSFAAPEMYANERMVAKGYLKAIGKTLPLWNTEAGYSTVFFLDPVLYPDSQSESARVRQAHLVLRNVLTQVALNEPIITVYRLMDKGFSSTDKEMNFGLLDAAGGEKPAFVALKTMHSMIKGLKFSGHHTDVAPGLHVLKWTDSVSSSSAKVFALWVDNPGDDVSVVLPSGTKSVHGWNGVNLGLRAGDSVVLSESRGPVYVKY